MFWKSSENNNNKITVHWISAQTSAFWKRKNILVPMQYFNITGGHNGMIAATIIFLKLSA